MARQRSNKALYFNEKSHAAFEQKLTPALLLVADFRCANVTHAIGRLIDDDKNSSGNQ